MDRAVAPERSYFQDASRPCYLREEPQQRSLIRWDLYLRQPGLAGPPHGVFQRRVRRCEELLDVRVYLAKQVDRIFTVHMVPPKSRFSKPTPTSVRPRAGALGPASLLSPLVRRRANSASSRLPWATSSMVPTRVRTIPYRKEFAVIP